MLLDLERRRGYGTATRHRVANELGINERTVRRRRDRAIAALRQAAPTYLASGPESCRGDGPMTSRRTIAPWNSIVACTERSGTGDPLLHRDPDLYQYLPTSTCGENAT